MKHVHGKIGKYPRGTGTESSCVEGLQMGQLEDQKEKPQLAEGPHLADIRIRQFVFFPLCSDKYLS